MVGKDCVGWPTDQRAGRIAAVAVDKLVCGRRGASGASGEEWGKWGERAGEVLLGMGQCSQPPRTQAQLTGALRDERTTLWGHLYCKLYSCMPL